MKDWSETTLKLTDTFEDAIKTVQYGGLRLALVLDEKNKLLGTITDGDIRRALLKHLEMDCSVSEVMNHNPLAASLSDSPDRVMSIMKSRDLLHIPILDKRGVMKDLETLQHLVYEKKSYDNPVFLMAGGFGSRLLPLTKEIPKPLLKLGERPILESIIMRFIDAGFHDFYISTHYIPEKISNYFGDGSKFGVSMKYVNEEKPLGTAGAIGLLPNTITKLPIIMMNGDVLTKVNIENLLKFHEQQSSIATMCIREYDIQIPFGVVNIHKQQLTSIKEKPIQKFFVNAGIYVFDPKLIHVVGENNKIDMPYLLEQQISNGESVSIFPIHEYWADIGSMREYQKAQNSFSNGFSLDD